MQVLVKVMKNIIVELLVSIQQQLWEVKLLHKARFHIINIHLKKK